MSIFSQIISTFSFASNNEKLIEINKKVSELEQAIKDLNKIVEDQRSMIHYLSTIQSDLAAECFTLSDTVTRITNPKRNKVAMFRIAADDDDDLIN
jgi:hypothetical protein